MKYNILFNLFIFICLSASFYSIGSYGMGSNDRIDYTSEGEVGQDTKQRGLVPCAKNDQECWCVNAVRYTNNIRKRYGVKRPLRVGPERQLQNAVRYAQRLRQMRSLKHQDLRKATREVGCSRFIGGENIAFNYEEGDIARACVTQWENSPGHLRNILSSRFNDVVVGFARSFDGRVYCVQTFSNFISSATIGSKSDTGCQRVRSFKNIPS